MQYNVINNVKGMTNMSNSKEIINFIQTLVADYSIYSRYDDCYLLPVLNIPDFHLNKLSALFMIQDESLASEANGFDNPAYEKSMLPALLSYMQNSTDKDEEIEFNKAWREGVTSYFLNTIQKMIDKECINRLANKRSELNLYPHQHKDNGETYWSRQA